MNINTLTANVNVNAVGKCMQAASFNYDLLCKVARAISDEVRQR